MNVHFIIQDFLVIMGSVLAGVLSLWRSHYNFERGYVRMGYVYLMLSAFAIMLFIYQSFKF